LSVTSFPLQNAACAIAAIDALELNISTQQIKQAIANVCVLGRFQIYHGPCEIILDVAHNPEAAKWLANKIAAKSISGKTRVIISICADKDWYNIVKPFLNFVDEWYIVQINNPRLLKANVLAENIKTLTSKAVFSCSSVKNAIEYSIDESLSIDRILVFGSFFTVAAVLKYINEQNYDDNN
jgi:dihydrofolate synthase/folylpolyglutamate synthase